MRKIDIGILRAAQIKFGFIGEFMLNGVPVYGENAVTVEENLLCFWCGLPLATKGKTTL